MNFKLLKEMMLVPEKEIMLNKVAKFKELDVHLSCFLGQLKYLKKL